MASVAWIFSEAGYGHTVPEGHVERPERLDAVKDAIANLDPAPPSLEAEKATREDLLRVHTDEHITVVEATCARSAPYPDPDTFMVPASWDAGLYAAGSAIAGCRAVLDGEYDRVFSVTRPPGHHAEADRAMGFCLFNNVAVAARWLQAEAGVKRVAILDWDVHHGNGTQHSTYDDADVYYVSIHEWPNYPGTGRPEERGAHKTNLNIPAPPGSPADYWLEQLERTIVPELETFQPDFFLISAGFDAHERDPLSHQQLTAKHFTEMTRMVRHLAGGRIVSLLEGGYDMQGLAESATAHFNALGEDKP